MLLNGKRRFVTLLPEGDNVRGGGCRESRYLRTAVLMKMVTFVYTLLINNNIYVNKILIET